jgi:nicotinamide-nucleotide amidase
MPTNPSVLPPEDISQHLGFLLRDRGETLSVAESCTGGRIAAALTCHAGASDFFLEGACVYSNAAKVRTCGVSTETLSSHGAVSPEIAVQLATGIRNRSQSTYGIGVTGIAGPSGGSSNKPVGTVHMALATPAGCTHHPLSLSGLPRNRVITLTTSLALNMLWSHLKDQ